MMAFHRRLSPAARLRASYEKATRCERSCVCMLLSEDHDDEGRSVKID